MSTVDQKSLPNDEFLRDCKNNSNTLAEIFRIRFQAGFCQGLPKFYRTDGYEEITVMGILSGDPTTIAKAIAKHSLPKPEKSQQTFMSAMRDVLRVIAVSSSLHFMSRHQGTNI
jgi:hypothetical protein